MYALYNKNKPKSDALMSEYGSVFFKVSALGLDQPAIKIILSLKLL